MGAAPQSSGAATNTVTQALVPGAGEDSGRRRDESRRGKQECVRHENRRGLRRF